MELYYTAFTQLDVITRSVLMRNTGMDAIWLDRVLSVCLSLPYEGQQLITLPGSWARERTTQRINPYAFCWKLQSGESFQVPEVVMIYSGEGLGKMTRTFHDLYRNHLIRSKYKFTPRPVLINNWEATYFDFDEERLLCIAEKAASLGIELFVLDDGWFGNRNTDNGLNGLADKVNALGMKFGIWMEPEMVSMDSKLYREHPDWVIRTQNRQPFLCRDQLVLDLSRPESDLPCSQSMSPVV